MIILKSISKVRRKEFYINIDVDESRPGMGFKKMIHKTSEKVNLARFGTKRGSIWSSHLWTDTRTGTSGKYAWQLYMAYLMVHCSHKVLNTSNQHVRGIDIQFIKGAKESNACERAKEIICLQKTEIFWESSSIKFAS